MTNITVYKQFLSSCDNGFVHIDQKGKILYVNRAVSDLTGRSEAELENSGLGMIFEPQMVEDIKQILGGRADAEVEAIRYGDVQQKHGPPRYAEIYINRTVGEEGEFLWLLIKNKSFRREIEQKLRERDLMLETTLESLPFDFWINDNENRTYMQNSHSRELWGNVAGKLPNEVADNEEVIEQWLDTTKRALGGEIQTSEISYIVDGRKRYYKNIVAPIMDDENIFGILGMNIDITDQQEALDARDMLLKEVHHRVKNNLQMIISIINLEAENTSCDGADEVFADIVNRIEAISLIHERLYASENNNIVHSADYLRELIDHLISGVQNTDIQVVYELEDIDLAIDKVITLGLITNELVTNALKYAFEGPGSSLLFVSMEQKDDGITVVIADNGPGLPVDFDMKRSASLGYRMIHVLARQLSGSVETSNAPEGFSVFIRFPLQ
jgi:PAS domain S-box-containing protein